MVQIVIQMSSASGTATIQKNQNRVESPNIEGAFCFWGSGPNAARPGYGLNSAMLRVYGVPGCGPCEVTKLFLGSRDVPFTFIDVASDPEKRRDLTQRLGSPTSGVILEDEGDLTVMQGVSVAKLSRYLEAYRARHSVG